MQVKDQSNRISSQPKKENKTLVLAIKIPQDPYQANPRGTINSDKTSAFQSDNFLPLLMKALFSKYSSSQNYYYTKDINDLLDGETTPATTKYQDILIFLEEEEYLKRTYVKKELKSKQSFLLEYYKFHKDIPRLFMKPVFNQINRYHDKKRRLEYARIKRGLGLPDDDEFTKHATKDVKDDKHKKGSRDLSVNQMKQLLKGVNLDLTVKYKQTSKEILKTNLEILSQSHSLTIHLKDLLQTIIPQKRAQNIQIQNGYQVGQDISFFEKSLCQHYKPIENISNISERSNKQVKVMTYNEFKNNFKKKDPSLSNQLTFNYNPSVNINSQISKNPSKSPDIQKKNTSQHQIISQNWVSTNIPQPFSQRTTIYQPSNQKTVQIKSNSTSKNNAFTIQQSQNERQLTDRGSLKSDRNSLQGRTIQNPFHQQPKISLKTVATSSSQKNIESETKNHFFTSLDIQASGNYSKGLVRLNSNSNRGELEKKRITNKQSSVGQIQTTGTYTQLIDRNQQRQNNLLELQAMLLIQAQKQKQKTVISKTDVAKCNPTHVKTISQGSIVAFSEQKQQQSNIYQPSYISKQTPILQITQRTRSQDAIEYNSKPSQSPFRPPSARIPSNQQQSKSKPMTLVNNVYVPGQKKGSQTYTINQNNIVNIYLEDPKGSMKSIKLNGSQSSRTSSPLKLQRKIYDCEISSNINTSPRQQKKR